MGTRSLASRTGRLDSRKSYTSRHPDGKRPVARNLRVDAIVPTGFAAADDVFFQQGGLCIS